MPAQFDAFQPPPHYQSIRCIDMHTGGEPLRVILSGFPALNGSTQLARRADCLARWDGLRQALMLEPRGHADMYGALITPPERASSDFGVLFLHNEGYSTMCGHAVIALARLSVDCGMVPPGLPLRIDTPAGQVCAVSDECGNASFINVPSFVESTHLTLHHPAYGDISVDIAFGGAYYAFVDARRFNLTLVPANARRLIDLGSQIKSLAAAAIKLRHPDHPDLSFLYGVIFTDDSPVAGVHSRHVCVFADGELDRSPTGTGVSARVALLHHRGLVSPGESIVIDSILGSPFTITLEQTTHHAGRIAIIPRIAGRAHVTGRHEFLIDPDDPLDTGFFLR